LEDVVEHQGSLNIALYLSNVDTSSENISLDEALQNWSASSQALESSMKELFNTLS
jgi:type I restriction enzyme M protein